MATLDTLVDDFEDGVVSTSIWANFTSGASEAGGFLSITSGGMVRAHSIWESASGYSYGAAVVQLHERGTGQHRIAHQSQDTAHRQIAVTSTTSTNLAIQKGSTWTTVTNVTTSDTWIKTELSNAASPVWTVSTSADGVTWTQRYQATLSSGYFSVTGAYDNERHRFTLMSASGTPRFAGVNVPVVLATTVTVPLENNVTLAGLAADLLFTKRITAPVGTATVSGMPWPYRAVVDLSENASVAGIPPDVVGPNPPTVVTAPVTSVSVAGITPYYVGPPAENTYVLTLLDSTPGRHYRLADGDLELRDYLAGPSGSYSSALSLTTGALKNDPNQASLWAAGVTATAPTFQIGARGFTSRVWFKGTSGTLFTLSFTGGPHTNTSIKAHVSGSKAAVTLAWDSSTNVILSTKDITDGAWHMIDVIYVVGSGTSAVNGSTHYLYVDGVLQNSVTFSSTAPSIIPGSAVATPKYGTVVGSMDEATLWDHTFVDQRHLLLEHYNQGTQATPPPMKVRPPIGGASAAALEPATRILTNPFSHLAVDDFSEGSTYDLPGSAKPVWESENAYILDGHIELPMDGATFQTRDFLVPYDGQTHSEWPAALPSGEFSHADFIFFRIPPQSITEGTLRVSAINASGQVTAYTEIAFGESPQVIRRWYWKIEDGNGFPTTSVVNYDPTSNTGLDAYWGQDWGVYTEQEDWGDASEWITLWNQIGTPARVRFETFDGLASDRVEITDFNRWPVVGETVVLTWDPPVLPAITADSTAVLSAEAWEAYYEAEHPDREIEWTGVPEGSVVIFAPIGRATIAFADFGLDVTVTAPVGASTARGLAPVFVGPPPPKVILVPLGTAEAKGYAPVFAGWAHDLSFYVPLFLIDVEGLMPSIRVPELYRATTTEIELRTRHIDVTLEVRNLEGALA